jgi:formylmethanofuran:tetrahydromethanopterin formyltransferase
MEINGVPIEDTFAEAFSMHMNRTQHIMNIGHVKPHLTRLDLVHLSL